MLDALPRRFWVKTAIADAGYLTPCLLWTGFKQVNGYGKFSINRRVQYAHRVAYEALVGPIPAGLFIDHLCRNRACVNVTHLEPVTNRENILRGQTIMAANIAKTHCPAGHEYTPENTRRTPEGGRHCRACARAERSARTERDRLARAGVAKEPPASCRKGHPYDDANTYVYPNGRRTCRACARNARDRYRHSKRSAL